MGKHKNPIGNSGSSHTYIPTHGGPVTGNGIGSRSMRLGLVKGVIFRLANGKPALPPKEK